MGLFTEMDRPRRGGRVKARRRLQKERVGLVVDGRKEEAVLGLLVLQVERCCWNSLRELHRRFRYALRVLGSGLAFLLPLGVG